MNTFETVVTSSVPMVKLIFPYLIPFTFFIIGLVLFVAIMQLLGRGFEKINDYINDAIDKFWEKKL